MRAVMLTVVGLLTLAASVEAHQPREWIPWTVWNGTEWVHNTCPRADTSDGYGEWERCWVKETRFDDEINDSIKAGDASYGSSATPRSADIYSGPNGDQASFYYGYDPAADCSTKTYTVGGTTYDYAELASADCQSTRAMFYVAMRLDGTPTVSGNPTPGGDVNGPFESSVAWNFIFDTTGDGFAEFVLSVDGNQGSNDNCNTPGNKCYDNQVLAFNTPGRGAISQPVITEPNQYFNEHVKQNEDPAGRLCSQTNPQGDILVSHDANRFNDLSSTKPPISGCANNLKAECDFGITATYNVDPNDCFVSGDPTDGADTDGNACNNLTPPYNATHGTQNFALVMQTPLDWFDDCTGANDDGDTTPGSQVIYPDTPFAICLTTSTQPNNFTLKDLGYEGTFHMDPLTALTCTDSCRLDSGCQQQPIIGTTTSTCGGSVPANTVRISTEILDTTTVNGSTVSDSINTVTLYYVQETAGGGVDPNATWTLIGTATRHATLINQWTRDWNVAALPLSPSPWYRIRAVVVDDGHDANSDGDFTDAGDIPPQTTDLAPIRIDVSSSECAFSTSPVTVAQFLAHGDGDLTKFRWTTSTEVGNLAFNVLVPDGQGGLRQVNETPIPAIGRDRVEPQTYGFQARGVDAEEFYLEDISTDGTVTRHGPFKLNRRAGKIPRGDDDLDPIDWRSVRAAAAPRLAAAKASGTTAGVEMLVRESGLYRVSYEQLQASGLAIAPANVQQLAVTNQGQPVPIRVVGGKNFGPGSFIEFYGQALRTLYTDTNVYLLAVDPKNSKRVSEERTSRIASVPAAYAETAQFGRQRRYTYATPTSDPWYDTDMLAMRGQSRQWSFALPVEGYVPGAGAAQLEVNLWGMNTYLADPDHHVKVRVNGQQLADAFFDGFDHHSVRVGIPEGVLREGDNQLTLELPSDLGQSFDLVYLDTYSVTYPRAFASRDGRLEFTAAAPSFRVDGVGSDALVYRVSGGSAALVPVVADGAGAAFAGSSSVATYVVTAPSAVRTPELRAARTAVDITSGSADYLVISHGAFLGGLAPLVSARQASGFTVKVVDVADVYAQFGHGIFGAQPIRDYIAHAASRMGVTHVLLVGGDTYDYRNYLQLGSMSFIPSLYARTDKVISHAPVDPLYADVDGDGVQDIAIGRFPVRTVDELDSVVRKTLGYRGTQAGATALFAADSDDLAKKVYYTGLSESLISQLDGGWDVTRAYVGGGLGAAKSTIQESLNDGVAFVNWLGHSGPTSWSMSSVFSAADATTLTNAADPTVVAQWGCWNTYHVSPYYNTLAHKLLLSGDQGAAAVLGPATLSAVESDAALSEVLTPALTRRGVDLGTAMVEAKQNLAARGIAAIDVVLGWTLLGDPGLIVNP